MWGLTMNKNGFVSGSEITFRDSFYVILMKDVILARERIEDNDTPAARRELIRTMFAAIEGYVWQYRSQVRSTVDAVSEISPMMALALSETNYSVSEAGKLTEQKRFLSMTATIRLVTRLAEANCSGLKIDFTVLGWSNLKRAIAIRNRATHPKNHSDLNITGRDIADSMAGLFWLLDMICTVLEAMTGLASEHLHDVKMLVQQLKAGDPATLAAYRTALGTISD